MDLGIDFRNRLRVAEILNTFVALDYHIKYEEKK